MRVNRLRQVQRRRDHSRDREKNTGRGTDRQRERESVGGERGTGERAGAEGVKV